MHAPLAALLVTTVASTAVARGIAFGGTGGDGMVRDHLGAAPEAAP